MAAKAISWRKYSNFREGKEELDVELIYISTSQSSKFTNAFLKVGDIWDPEKNYNVSARRIAETHVMQWQKKDSACS